MPTRASNDTRQRIVECAFRLFLSKGFEATTMMDLVQASGLSKGAFYYYFKSKDELRAAAIEHFFLRYFVFVPPVNDSFPSLVATLWRSYVRLLSDMRTLVPDLSQYYRFLFSVMPIVSGELAASLDAARRLLQEKVVHERKQGRMRPEPPAPVVADQILSMIEGVGFLLVLDQSEDLDARFDSTVGSYARQLCLAPPEGSPSGEDAS